MHFHAEVYIPTNQDVEAQVKEAMAPYYEESSPEGFWDCYQIGGGWKGAHIPEYSQEDDPKNQEIPCHFCGGTGKRADDDVRRWYEEETDKSKFEVLPDGTIAVECGNCGGKGIALAWPTRWEPHPKDIIPVSEIPDDLEPYTLILPSKVLHVEEWEPSRKQPEEMKSIEDVGRLVDGPLKSKKLREVLVEEGITSGYLVTVDYHG